MVRLVLSSSPVLLRRENWYPHIATMPLEKRWGFAHVDEGRFMAMSLRRRPAWSWTAARGEGESPCVEGARRQGRRSSATAEATGGRREVNASNQNIRCAIEQIKSNLWQPEYLLSYPRLGSLLGPLRTLPRMGGAAEGQTGRAPHLG
jgi:hypothetical protein